MNNTFDHEAINDSHKFSRTSHPPCTCRFCCTPHLASGKGEPFRPCGWPLNIYKVDGAVINSFLSAMHGWRSANRQVWAEWQRLSAPVLITGLIMCLSRGGGGNEQVCPFAWRNSVCLSTLPDFLGGEGFSCELQWAQIHSNRTDGGSRSQLKPNPKMCDASKTIVEFCPRWRAIS